MHRPLAALNPLPDHERWAAIEPFEARIEAAIDEVSAYWERTAGDLIPVLADVGKVEAMGEARALLGRADGGVGGRPPSAATGCAAGGGRACGRRCATRWRWRRGAR